MAVSDKTTMSWTDYRGRTLTREINHVIDIRDFIGRPCYPELFVAANTHLSVRNMEMFLRDVVGGCNERTPSWLARRRWMSEPPGTINKSGVKRNADGKDEQAIRIMSENRRMSVRALARLLRKDHGITRSSEWVRQHRCDGVTNIHPYKDTAIQRTQ
jgi:hypothetical protein